MAIFHSKKKKIKLFKVKKIFRKSFSEIKNLLVAFPAAMDNVCPDKPTEKKPPPKRGKDHTFFLITVS